ncbi:PolC-type DNA polymerase III [Anaerococcus vaginalis]|uniref:PolC-type DNA polymerase III n=1 Tax=Anaerococcus vaginalis TaxID=33037 RepID=UPI00290DCFFB|nr:PolC-type DNA polymerase III [Anaerococcus vaginalis]MDU5251889.1 PolC-type DNA polymerase III [Anaerococcus vaginalis]MDU6781348.1 PolC-type DNA polymerase III [Anaerococcus vaginalis]
MKKMKINLKSIIEIDKDYYINKAIYSKKLNKLKLNILGEYDENIEKKLESYFSYVNLSLQFEKENKKETNSIDDFYESQPLPDYYETGYENPENLGENNEEKNQESKESSLNNQDIFDLPKIKEEKKEPSKNQEEEKASSLRDLKKIELENMIENARNNKKNSEKKEINQAEILKYGRNINGDLFKIEEIYDKKGMNLSIKGEIFGIDVFESKRGNFIYSFDLEDESDAIACKMFVQPRNKSKLENFKENMIVQVQGVLNYDSFSHEDVFTVNSMVECEKKERLDTYPKKRVELEIHTKMTNLDGFVDMDELAKKLKAWGHSACGITDTETLQALPDMYDKLGKNDIKMLAGAELLLVDKNLRILTNNYNKKINDISDLKNQRFIVFDLETTGLSKYIDKITEIGAVKIENGEIVEVFNELVNPEKMIPQKVVELTGITNEMVMDKPKIDKVLPRFLEFSKDSYFVGQNTDFDIGFITEACQKLSYKFEPVYLDTLPMARAVFPYMGRFSLDKLAKKLGVGPFNHHRASDDAMTTAKIFIKLFEKIKDKNKDLSLEKINSIKTKWPIARHENFSSIIFAKNYHGLKNLYKIISESRMKYFNLEAKTPFDLVKENKEGLIIGSGGKDGLLFKAIRDDFSEEKIEKICEFFDFFQIEAIGVFADDLENGSIRDKNQIIEINKKIIELGKKYNKLVVATGSVRYMEKKDYVLRNILHKGQFFHYKENNPLYYLKTTNEMLDEFYYLDDQTKMEVVIDNTIKVADSLESIMPIPHETFPPKIEGSDKKLKDTTYEKAISIYGDPLPDLVKTRLDKELDSIISNGYAVLYIIAKELVEKSNEDGYLVGSRGSVGSSFAATMANITEVNPLAPHYVCPECKHSEFITDGSVGAGIDLPDKTCPKCGAEMNKDGHDIPFEVFLGFEGDKEPDIDLNFAGEYQPTIHKYTEELFGEGKVFRAGTIGTIKDNTAFGYIKKYMEDNDLTLSNAQIRKYQRGLFDVKRTTGQHPGGLMIVPNDKNIYDFSPVQYPADDGKDDIKTTHFTYNMMHGVILKLDLLGHDVPTIIRSLQDLTNTDPLKLQMDDENVMNIFSSTKPLNIKYDFSNNEIGTLGIPEFGTSFVRGMLKDTFPTKFSEMTRISGLSHGTDVWLNNAQDLVKSKTAGFDQIISTRDDIMNSLINLGLDKKKSFQIMEKVRKGKTLSEETLAYMKENKVPDWYIDSCLKIKYLFPKAHAVAYCLMSYRIAYYKVYYPKAFYATYFSTKLNDFQYSVIVKGLKSIQYALNEINQLEKPTQREKNLRSLLEVAEEMAARDIKIKKADLYKSEAVKFILDEDGEILPPLSAVDDVSEAMAKDIVIEREKAKFISIEDLKKRTSLNKNALNSLKNLDIIDGLQEENQMSLFDL